MKGVKKWSSKADIGHSRALGGEQELQYDRQGSTGVADRDKAEVIKWLTRDWHGPYKSWGAPNGVVEPTLDGKVI